MNLSQRYARAQKALKPLNILQGYCRISSRERLGPNYCFFRTEFGSTRSYVIFQFILYFVSDFTFLLMSQAVRKLQELPFYSISYLFFYFTVHLSNTATPVNRRDERYGINNTLVSMVTRVSKLVSDKISNQENTALLIGS